MPAIILLLMFLLTNCTFADGSKWPFWYYAPTAYQCEAHNSDVARGVAEGPRRVCQPHTTIWIWEVNTTTQHKEGRP